MEQQKHKNSDTSGAEGDHNQPEKPTEDSFGGGSRSYECTFCKRGFTNAQALGGHMNLHRKDRGKAKSRQKKHDADSSIQDLKSNENYKTLSSSPQVLSNDFNLVFGGHVNCQVYFPSTSMPGIETGNSYQYNNYVPVWRPDHLIKDHMDVNLSQRIGLRSSLEDEEEVDLELRLGQYP